nr:MAG TPA: hypothetical protein [Bacteriophage sp.]DAQ68162.1 MAG TPA: hypothetical protein [Bacteriophage sp.]
MKSLATKRQAKASRYFFYTKYISKILKEKR